MKKLFIYFTILTFIVSCNKKVNFTKKLVISNTIFLPAENYVLESTSCIDYIKIGDNAFLYYLTNNLYTKSNEVLVYDLLTKKLIKKIIFDTKNGFPKSIHGFSLINKDSMIVSNILSDTIYSTNLNGGILKKYPYTYSDPRTGQSIFKLFTRNEKPIIGYKNKLFFSPSLFFSKKEDLDNSSLLFHYDCDNKKVENLNFKFPKEYQNSKFFSTNLSYCSNNDKIIFSPSNSHSIWVYNIKSKTYKTFNVESDYFRHFCENNKNNIKMNDAMYNTVFNSSYSEIVYDKYRKLYYRFFYPGIDIEKDADDLAVKTNHFVKMSIIILDENFKKVGENLFDNKLRFYSNFVNEDGLYVCSNLPNEKNKNKNLKYTLLKIKND